MWGSLIGGLILGWRGGGGAGGNWGRALLKGHKYQILPFQLSPLNGFNCKWMSFVSLSDDQKFFEYSMSFMLSRVIILGVFTKHRVGLWAVYFWSFCRNTVDVLLESNYLLGLLSIIYTYQRSMPFWNHKSKKANIFSSGSYVVRWTGLISTICSDAPWFHWLTVFIFWLLGKTW